MSELAVERWFQSTLSPKLSVTKHPPKVMHQLPTLAPYVGEHPLFITGLQPRREFVQPITDLWGSLGFPLTFYSSSLLVKPDGPPLSAKVS